MNMLGKSALLWYTGYFLSGMRLQNVFVYVVVNFEIVDAMHFAMDIQA